MTGLSIEWAASLLLLELIAAVAGLAWMRRDRAKRMAQLKRLVDMTEELSRTADGTRNPRRSQDGDR